MLDQVYGRALVVSNKKCGVGPRGDMSIRTFNCKICFNSASALFSVIVLLLCFSSPVYAEDSPAVIRLPFRRP